MKPDELLRQLGSLAREESDAWLEDPRLTKLRRGELSGEELGALETEAKGSRDLALAIDLLRPLPRETRQRVIDGLTRPPPAEASPMLHHRTREVRRWVTAAATACLFGVGAIMVTRAPAIPVLRTTVAVISERGNTESAPDVARPLQLFDAAHLHLEIGLAGLEGDVEARAFLLRDGEVMPWAAAFTQSADRKVMLDGPVEVLFKGVPRGTWEVVLAVGRVARLPDDAEDLEELLAKDPSDDEPVRYVRQTIVLETKDETTLMEAETLRKNGKHARARDKLLPLLGATDIAIRARATGKLARVAAATGDTDAELEEAIGGFRAAITLDRQARLVADEHLDTYALSYWLAVSGRFGDARAALKELPPPTDAFPDAKAQTAYYQGVVSKEAGDYGAALSSFKTAGTHGALLGLTALVLDATASRIALLISIGRDTEARALMPVIEDALRSEQDACKRAELLDNIGALWLVLRPEAVESTERTLESAVSAYRETCKRPRSLANALTSLAAAKLSGGHAEDARRNVASARGALRDAGPIFEAEWEAIDGKALLSLGRHEEALSAFERLARMGLERAMPEAEWTAAVGRARTLDALRRFDEAGRAFAEAATLVARRAIIVPLGQGRDAFLAKVAEAGQFEVDFLLRRGTPEQAASAARRNRSRSLALLRWSDRIDGLGEADRKRWNDVVTRYRRSREDMDAGAGDPKRLAAQVQASIDQALTIVADTQRGAVVDTLLEAPGADEVFLVYHEVKGGWVGFAVTQHGAKAARLGPLELDAPDTALASILFGPFDAEIEHASRVRVMAPGSLGMRDLHALPWKEKPLVATHVVSYGLDVRSAAVAHPRGAEPDQSVVVGDPSSNLDAARLEAVQVAETLTGRGVNTRLLIRKDATLDAVRGALESPGTSFFHYAGHASFAGLDGWQSGLPLASGGFLGVRDVLVLSHVPGTVVLSGCTTGLAPGTLGLGLAQAFVVAGANSVVATTREVDDRLARRVMEAFYGSARAHETAGGDAAWALQDATRAMMNEANGGDWASFRVIVP